MNGSKPWEVLGRRSVYESAWVGVEQWDVRLPDGSRIPDHHVVVYPVDAVGVVALGTDGTVLLVDHYRFMTDSRSWELPAGHVDEGETVEQAARRELLEETGHNAANWQQLGSFYPANGSSTLKFHLWLARDLSAVNSSVDANETLGLQWFSADEVRANLHRNAHHDGLTMAGLFWWLSLAGSATQP